MMKLVLALLLALFILFTGCSSEPEIIAEPWVNKPVNEWPDFALTNEVSFVDTTYIDLANGFLINTGKDTLAVSCKHIFMVFENPNTISSIDLGDDFRFWNLYPKNDPQNKASIKRLINKNKKEPIGEFRTLKDRDWIIMELQDKNTGIYPLKVRFTPLKKNEIVYALGWGSKQKNNDFPLLQKMQVYKPMGNYNYVKVLTENVEPYGRSGSPVIDKNGYLVGIISGAEGKLGVIGSVKYLKTIMDKYNVAYYDGGE